MNNEQPPAGNAHSLGGFVEVGVNLEFCYAAGETASRFLIALRDEKRIYGTRCPECRRVLVPARDFCPRCNANTGEWVEVGPRGTLVALGVVQEPRGYHAHTPPSAHSKGAPVVYGLIHLDGADTNFLHLIGDTQLNAALIGKRVEAVFAENRTGSILDIAFFRPEDAIVSDDEMHPRFSEE